ncbi:MAG: FliM/FliN family flagellar motor switch protein [Planctomycetes bacterium]|nr:FliM/FliN family flagellar motor switch protein [Planctomycetota bacterium]
MLIDQDEINDLLNQAEQLSADVDDGAPPRPPTASAAAEQVARLKQDPELARLMRIRVPVIVRLARRVLAIDNIRRFSSGFIIEFERHVEDELDLMINNRVLGSGTAVKVGESFGLRIAHIKSKAARIKSLGA